MERERERERVMDLRTVMTISTLLLMSTESDQALTDSPDANETSDRPILSNSTERDCSCDNAAPTAVPTSFSPNSDAPVLAVLRINWASGCKGDLILYHNFSSPSPVCHNSEAKVSRLLVNVCQNKKGCKGTPRWDGGDPKNGYYIEENGAVKTTACKTMRVQCTVEVIADVQGQLQAYKVVTALLCCMVLLMLLIRFTTPTVKALQKRLSDRRQNRWIGPTQSHSVSYHRGKTAVKNNDGEKRLSYPALERLTVSDSREPSSNRNSDFNL